MQSAVRAARMLDAPNLGKDEWFQEAADSSGIEARIAERAEAKTRRDFAAADRIRDELRPRASSWRMGQAALLGARNERAALYAPRSCGWRRRSGRRARSSARTAGPSEVADLWKPVRTAVAARRARAESPMSQHVHACAFGQASAALTERGAMGARSR